MKIYLNTQQIPQLKGMTFQQRMAAIDKAAKQLTTPERVLLNSLKLVLLTLCFVWIFYLSQLWAMIVAVLVIVLCYPLVIRPLQYTMASKYLTAEKERDD